MTWPRTWARRAGSRARCSDHLVDHVPREVGGASPAELRRAEDAAAAQVGREIGVARDRLQRLTPGLGAVRGRDQARVPHYLGQTQRRPRVREILRAEWPEHFRYALMNHRDP